MRMALTLGLAVFLTASSARAESWDMPMAYPDGNFHTQTGKQFADCVKAGTKGDLTITVHGNGSLFKGNEIKRAVQTGQAPIGERLLSAHENENALFGFDAVPFLATSFDASDRLWASAQPTITDLLQDQNLVLLYSVPWPPQGLYTKAPIKRAADLKGVKFRAYNAATAKFAALTGAVPVQIEASELAQALATGVADSFISSGATGHDVKVWESLHYFYDVQAWLPRNYVFANKDSYDGLAKPSQEALTICAAKAATSGEAEAKRLTGSYLAEFKEHGMTVVEPDKALEADLAAIGQTMTADWIKKTGAKGQTILDAYQKD